MKLIIDIEESDLYAIKTNQYYGKELEKMIANGTPYNPTGDCISREALIKWIDDSVSQYGHTYSTDMLNMWGLFKDYLINNAPTVEAFTNEDMAGAYNEGYACGGRESTRPQGEWIEDLKSFDQKRMTIFCKCSNCGCAHYFSVKTSYNKQVPICPYCNADMKGGAE